MIPNVKNFKTHYMSIWITWIFSTFRGKYGIPCSRISDDTSNLENAVNNLFPPPPFAGIQKILIGQGHH